MKNQASLRDSDIRSFGLRVWNGLVTQISPPHRHNEIELNAIEEGYFTYLLAGQQITIRAGEVGLFWGAIPHQVIAFAAPTRVHWGTIPLSHVLRWELPQPFVHQMLTGQLITDGESLYGFNFFRMWADDLRAGRQAVALMEIRALFFRMSQQTKITDQADPPRDQPLVIDQRASQMAVFISRRFAEPLTVGQIAAEVGLHPGYAMQVFRRAFGLTLIDYLTQQRIAHAQQMLILTDLSITTIALDSGFQTLSHFYTAFQRMCGLSPGRYRASLRA